MKSLKEIPTHVRLLSDYDSSCHFKRQLTLFMAVQIYMSVREKTEYLVIFVFEICSPTKSVHISLGSKENDFFFFFFFFLIVIQLQLSAFSPHPSTPPQLNPPPSPTSTLPLDFVHVSFIVAPVNPSPHYPLPTHLWLLLHCS